MSEVLARTLDIDLRYASGGFRFFPLPIVQDIYDCDFSTSFRIWWVVLKFVANEKRSVGSMMLQPARPLAV